MTVTVPDLEAALALCAAGLGHRVQRRGTLAAELAAFWQVPDMAGAAWALSGPDGTDTGLLRLVEHAASGHPPLTAFGWAAAELGVQGADVAVTRAVAAGFALVGAPRALGSNPAIRAGQVGLPGGAALYLTDLSAYDGPLDIARPGRPVDRCFIAVLASPDLEADRAWIEANLAAARVSDRPVSVPVLQQTLELDPEETVRISSVQLADGCLIEIDAYPAESPDRTATGWPAGVAMLTLAGDVPDGAVFDDPPYAGRSARIDRLPGGAMIERIAA